MSDVFSKEKRSSIMSANRGRGNRSTEWRLRARLVGASIAGWRINARDVTGKPDFVFDGVKLAIYVDGCFWHGCTHCRNLPASNREFWKAKIEGNKRRDIAMTRALRRQGWHVLRFWEHQLRLNPASSLQKIKRTLSKLSA